MKLVDDTICGDLCLTLIFSYASNRELMRLKFVCSLGDDV